MVVGEQEVEHRVRLPADGPVQVRVGPERRRGPHGRHGGRPTPRDRSAGSRDGLHSSILRSDRRVGSLPGCVSPASPMSPSRCSASSRGVPAPRWSPSSRATRSTPRSPPTGEHLPLADVRLLAPVIPRSKVVGVGRNYADHAAEMGGEVPGRAGAVPQADHVGDRPGRGDLATRASPPRCTTRRELAVVIGRLCRDVPVERVARGDLRLHRAPTTSPPATCSAATASGPGPRASTRSARSGPWIETELDVGDLAVDCTRQRRGAPGTAAPAPMVHERARADRLRHLGDDAAARRRHPHRHPGRRRADGARRRGRA